MEARGTDPRNLVTPDAFHVAPALLGTPLATPKRRAAALLVDLALAAVLVKLGGVLIGLAVAVVFFRVATRTMVDDAFTRWARAGLALMGAFMLCITSVAVIESDDDDDDDAGQPAEALQQTALWTADSMDIPGLAEAMEAASQAGGDAAVQAQLEALEPTLPEVARQALGLATVPSDSLGPEERAEASTLLHAYAEALAAEDRTVLDSLQQRAAALVAGPSLARLRQRIGRQAEQIDGLEDENERLADEAAHPGLRRILKAVADDIGLGIGWIGLYFTLFLAWWQGQTPGKKLFGLQVVRLDGKPISLWVAFERFGGYAAGVATGLLGFFQVFWDANRQGVQDRIAGTVVIRKGMAGDRRLTTTVQGEEGSPEARSSAVHSHSPS